jgi:competence protein ComFC
MWFSDLLSYIFPEHCIGCNKVGSALCALCERTITTKPTALSGTTAALFDYRHPLIKKAIWALKYHRRRALAQYFGTALYREFFKALARGGAHRKEAIILIPIPGGKKAIAMRGYNHASLIAEAIRACAKADGLLITVEGNLLYKKKEISQQVAAREKAKREKNVEWAFYIRDAEKIAGKTIILIDDVITTGATINEARRTVKACAPKRVLAIAVAH